MTIRTFYRASVWLPIALPAGVVVATLWLDLAGSPLRGVAGLSRMILLYGGIPYIGLALWATWWIEGKEESAIHVMMARAPILMAGWYLAFAILIGLATGRFEQFLAVGVLGAVISIPVGYAFVVVVALARRLLRLETS